MKSASGSSFGIVLELKVLPGCCLILGVSFFAPGLSETHIFVDAYFLRFVEAKRVFVKNAFSPRRNTGFGCVLASRLDNGHF